MASGVREGRGDTKTWDLDQKSGTWDEKRISEPAKVESSSANFSMDQVIYMFLIYIRYNHSLAIYNAPQNQLS